MTRKRPNRIRTKYPEVYYEERQHRATRQVARFFYVRYRRGGKRTFQYVGSSVDGWTPARANAKRMKLIDGTVLSNKEIRESEKAVKKAEKNRWTIERLWEEYKSNRKIKGLVTDQNRFENHIKPTFGEKDPSEIVAIDITRVKNSLLKKRKAGTVRNVLELLRRIINFGIEEQLIPPVSYKIKMPAVDNEKTENLTADQFLRLLETIERDKNIQAANLMKAVLHTGLRRGDLFKLKWEHIDFESGFISIVDPKGGKKHLIPLSQTATELFQNHEKPHPESPYVFPGKDGRRRTDIKRPVNRIKKAAGLPKDFRALHGLRHVYASMMASSGQVDMYTLQTLLSHKSSQMTQRYAHLSDDALKKAAELAARIIKQASEIPGTKE